VTLLLEWLARSGQCLLSIRLRYSSDRGDGGSDSDSEEDVHNLDEDNVDINFEQRTSFTIPCIIASVSERWRHMEFELPELYYEPLHHLENRLPVVASMAVDIWGTPRTQSNMFGTAPNLLDVEIKRCFFEGNQWLSLPLKQMTRISLTSLRVSDCLDIIRSTPCLVHCTFDDLYQSPQPPTALHLRLETFVVKPYLNSRDSLSNFLDAIPMRSAREIAFDTAYAIPFPLSHFIEFITSSMCTLVRLALAHTNIGEAELVQCPQVLPSLSELEVRDLNITHKTLNLRASPL
jgi:hypothetical protein